MILGHIHKENILQTANYIDKNGILPKYQSNTYWVKMNDKEYPFKYLVRIAHRLIEGNENQWLDFNSRKEYRDYVQSLGFSIVSYLSAPPFFTYSDIADLSAIAGEIYDPDSDVHSKVVEGLKNNAWEKQNIGSVKSFLNWMTLTGYVKKFGARGSSDQLSNCK